MFFFCIDYIDEVFGDKSLWPSKPNPKAQSRILVTDFGDKVIYIMSNCSMCCTLMENQGPKLSALIIGSLYTLQ